MVGGAMPRVVVGLSGGVDSSIAAYMLKQQGYDVVGIYMRNWTETTGLAKSNCPFDEDVDFAMLVARRLAIPFEVVDLSGQYRRDVVDYLFAEYGKGRTPNPDVLCNREVKFKAFWEVAQARGAEYVATGHYCRKGESVDPHGTQYHSLLAGVDASKDQSYFLCQVNQQQLEHALFPVGGMLKGEVRRLASELGLASAARKDSYGICFVGEVDLPEFLAQKLERKEGAVVEIARDCPVERDGEGGKTAPGDFDLPARAKPYALTPALGVEIGRHQGAHFYTVGQRKGLHIGGKALPLFVLGVDVLTNTLYVGQGHDHPYLNRQVVFIERSEVHWIWAGNAPSEGSSMRVEARLRYRQPLQPATLHAREEGVYLEFENAQRGVTPGQFAAWYSGAELLGSGPVAW